MLENFRKGPINSFELYPVASYMRLEMNGIQSMMYSVGIYRINNVFFILLP